MFVDSSALVAMIVPEQDGSELSARLEKHRERQTTPLAIFEATLALKRISSLSLSEALHILTVYLQRANIAVVEIGREAHLLALLAHDRYGKGSGHPAKLNLGDCFSYAAAKQAGVPLLYKGDDFAHTDLA